MRLPLLLEKTFCKSFLALSLLALLWAPMSGQALTATQRFNHAANTTGNNAGYQINEGNTSISALDRIGKYINILLSFLGVVFLFLMVYGGLIWMNARGQEQALNKAKSIIRNALIGLVIVSAAYAITYFAGQVLAPGTTGQIRPASPLPDP